MSPIELENCVIEECFVEETGSTSTDLLNYVKSHSVLTLDFYLLIDKPQAEEREVGNGKTLVSP